MPSKPTNDSGSCDCWCCGSKGAKGKECRCWCCCSREGAYVLTMIGALIYLYLSFAWMSGQLALTAALSGRIGTLYTFTSVWWSPLVFGVAMISSVVLFVVSLMGFAGRRFGGGRAATSATWWGGISLFILTAPGEFFIWALIGFLFAYVGSSNLWARAMAEWRSGKEQHGRRM